jgi:hypothetical protein
VRFAKAKPTIEAENQFDYGLIVLIHFGKSCRKPVMEFEWEAAETLRCWTALTKLKNLSHFMPP